MNQAEETSEEQLQHMVKLSQKISDICDGEPMLVVQGALGHLLVQIVMRGNNNDMEKFDGSIDVLAKAMKADARLLVEHIQRQEMN